MAHKLNLSSSPIGMPFIWNVSQRVGTEKTEPNLPTDVRLCKLLLLVGLDTPGAAPSLHPALRVKPTINDQMDIVLGFWIYVMQVEVKGRTFKADGFISPGPKFQSGEFLIHRLNELARRTNGPAWQNLPDHPLCGAALRAELLAPPR